MEDLDKIEACQGHCNEESEHILEHLDMPSDQSMESLADFFKVFGDKTRIRILYLLKNQELCVCDLADCLGMTSPAVSHQLRILKINRLIKSRRQGKSVYYSLDDQHIHGILGESMTHLTEGHTH